MTGKTAIIFGASGLVGSNLVKELIKNTAYTQLYLVVRKPLAVVNMKVREIALDKFRDFDLSGITVSDVHVFCCVGTTIKKAGSQQEFRKVDFELPVQAATWAKSKGIETFSVVSSIGANSQTSNFYLKTKGEMEEALKKINFKRLFIARPSLLLGTRAEFRLGEEIAKMFSGLMKILLFGSFKKFKPIEAVKVARAMMLMALSDENGGIYESDKLEAIS